MAFFYFNDTVNLLSKLSVPRIFNIWKVVSSYYYSKWTGRVNHWGLPISISIEPTNYCNLRCPECPSGLRSFTRETGMLQTDFFRNTIDQVKDNLWYLVFYFQGEPFLHKGFLEMVKFAAGKGIYTATSTNAHFLDDQMAKATVESGLDRLIISIDGATQETYEAYRVGGELDKVLTGAKNIVKWKQILKSKTPHLIFQFLVVAPNEHETNTVRKMAKSIGVNEVRLKTAQIYNYKYGSQLIPLNKKYSRYTKQPDGTYLLKNKLHNHCWKLWHSSVVTWDGNVVPCCFDKDAQHRMGDLRQHPFAVIWQGKAYKHFRSKVLRSRKDIDICANCSEGTTVWG